MSETVSPILILDEVINEVYDLFIDLDASDDQIEFPILFTDAKSGIAHLDQGSESKNLTPLFETIISKIIENSNSKWVTYLSATSVYGDHKGEWVNS